MISLTSNSLLSIDPGLSLGWAFFPAEKIFPVKAGLIKPAVKGKDFFVQLHSTVIQYANMLKELAPREVAIEWPAFYSSVGGRAAAGSGSVVKLAFEVGMLAQVAHVYGANFIPVEVVKWKGQLPKKIVEQRIRRILSASRLLKLNPQKDCWDALGIGLFCRGKFK